MTPTGAGLNGEVAAKAEVIRQQAEGDYTKFRNRGDLSTQEIQRRIATIFLRTKQALANMADQAGADFEKATTTATTRAFGIADLAGNDPVNQASVSMSYRQAQDRASTLGDETAALAMLAQAESTGDELQARAVAWTASAQGTVLGGLVWSEVLEAFAATRPKAGDAINTLLRLRQVPKGTSGLFAFLAFAAPIPVELAGLTDYQISALSAGAADVYQV